MDRRAGLRHGLTFEAHEKRKGIAMLFKPDAPGSHIDEAVGRLATRPAPAAADAELQVAHPHPALRPVCQVDHAATVQRDHDGLRVVVEILPDYEHGLAVAVALGI